MRYVDPSGCVIEIVGFGSDYYNSIDMCQKEYDESLKQYELAIDYLKQRASIFKGLNIYTYISDINSIIQSYKLYGYAVNNPLRFVYPSGHSAKDILAGITSSFDQNILGGFSLWLWRTIMGNPDGNYRYENEYDYYLGRTIGNGLCIAIGTGTTVLGALEIVGAILGGAAITVGTGGLGAPGGVTIAIGGVILGAVEMSVGSAIVLAAYDNFGKDFAKMDHIRMTTKEATTAAEKLGYKKTNQYSHGQPVYERVSGDGPKYITPDVDGHNGGTWKGANNIKDLGSKATRSGTYNGGLQRIGD